MKILIIIPAYNEENNINDLINKVNNTGYDYLVINDHSNDNTKDILNDNNINCINLPNNLGLAKVLQVGYKYAYQHNYNAVATLDGDGQHNPEYLNDLFKEIDNGYEYILGSRFLNKKKPYNLRMIGSRILTILIKILTGTKVNDPTSGMKVIAGNLLQELSNDFNYVAEPDMIVSILKKGFKLKEVQVDMNDREQGISHFSNKMNTIKYMLKVITSIIFVQSIKTKGVYHE